MEDREIVISIKIISGKTCGFGYTAITVPEDMELNKALKEMIKEKTAAVEVEKVLCKEANGSFAVSFECKIDNIENARMVMSYALTEGEYRRLNAFFLKEKNPKKARNNDMAILLIKQIIDTYENPYIEITSD